MALGFNVRLFERLLDSHTRRQDGEPKVILSGLDNLRSRRYLGSAGFLRTIDAGLGSSHDRYQNILVRSFFGKFDSRSIYEDPIPSAQSPDVISAYEREISEQVEAGSREADVRCGILGLAGKAVGVSFVGAVAAALVLSEVLRPLHGGTSMELVSVDLGNLGSAMCQESLLKPPHEGFIRRTVDVP